MVLPLPGPIITPNRKKYADYVFASNNIEIKNFKVLPDEVSDHRPLLVEID